VVETSSYDIIHAASHRIASLATVRHALYPRELQRRSDAVRRSCECGVEVRHSTAAIHQQDRPCHSLHITIYAPTSTRKTAEAKSRYVYLSLCTRGDAIGRGGTLRVKSRNKRGIFSSKSPTRKMQVPANALSPEANAPVCKRGYLHHMPSFSR
jgi:hypothetical protein